MKSKLDYEVTDKQMNLKITIIGIIYTCFRVLSMALFINPDGAFDPEALHLSYFLSILIGFSMIFSFRVRPLNVISVALLPSILVTIFFHDIPIWIDPTSAGFGVHVVGDLFWWNFITIHIPIPFISFYMLFTRKDTLSIPGIFMVLPVGLTWLFTLDDLQNGTLNGLAYLAAAIPMITIWGLIYVFLIMKDFRTVDPIIAPVLRIKSFTFTEYTPAERSPKKCFSKK